MDVLAVPLVGLGRSQQLGHYFMWLLPNCSYVPVLLSSSAGVGVEWGSLKGQGIGLSTGARF